MSLVENVFICNMVTLIEKDSAQGGGVISGNGGVSNIELPYKRSLIVQ